MLSYVEGRAVRPLVENQTLLILCATTVVVMMGHGIIGPVLVSIALLFAVFARETLRRPAVPRPQEIV